MKSLSSITVVIVGIFSATLAQEVTSSISPGFTGRMYFPGDDGKIYEITVVSD